MKSYDAERIKAYIEENKDNIRSVSIGLKEDWSQTNDLCYEDGKFRMNLNRKKLTVMGISGSHWATPCMRVTYKDGTSEVLYCFSDDGDEADEAEKREAMKFCLLTGGGDYVW